MNSPKSKARRVLAAAAVCTAVATSGAQAGAQTAAVDPIIGRWRIERTQVAPWVRRARSVSPNRRWIGQIVTFAPARVDGPGVLRCTGARYRATSMQPDALFQGTLTAPIADAVALGLLSIPVPGTRLSCSTGVFEFHRADETSTLLALDNVIYILSRAAGALAPDTAPAGVVERLLEQHFAGSMRFDAAHLATLAPLLSDSLVRETRAYLARPADPSLVPAIDGDPFSDTQQYPTRFAVNAATVKGDVAMVSVRFVFERSARTVDYALRRQGGVWRVNDLRYPGRGTLRKLMRSDHD